MVKVNFYETMEDNLLKFAVIAARYHGKWVFCKHRERETYEVPGGHREPGELIHEAAKRELYEETGASDYELTPVCVYSVTSNDGVEENEKETFGMLYYAEIKKFDQLPDYEMEKILLFDTLPDKLTYPQIQPLLVEKVSSFLHAQK